MHTFTKYLLHTYSVLNGHHLPFGNDLVVCGPLNRPIDYDIKINELSYA